MGTSISSLVVNEPAMIRVEALDAERKCSISNTFQSQAHTSYTPPLARSTNTMLNMPEIGGDYTSPCFLLLEMPVRSASRTSKILCSV